jgi:tubby-related protein 1
MYPEYRVYMKLPDEDRDLFLMCGKKRSGQKTSNYLISMSEGDLRRTSNNYLGKLRANFVGTEFRIYDNGSNPDDVDHDDPNSGDSLRQEMGVVQYESNVLGSRGPRKMQVGLPEVDQKSGEQVVFQPSKKQETMMGKLKKRDFTHMVYAYNKPPRWNDAVGAFVLNFNGRVTMASVKNFQLISHDDQERIIVQFGRVAKDEFTMDFQWPVSPFQAFAITLSSFDSKIACD